MRGTADYCILLTPDELEEGDAHQGGFHEEDEQFIIHLRRAWVIELLNCYLGIAKGRGNGARRCDEILPSRLLDCS